MATKDKDLTALFGQMRELAERAYALTQDKTDRTEQTLDGILHFTEKEILKMPSTFRKEFKIEGCVTHVRKRTDGRYKCSYEIRYRRNGYNISASGATVEIAKSNFIDKLKHVTKDDIYSAVPTTFHKFALYWLENFHKRKVCPETYAYTVRVFNLHIKPQMHDMELRKVTPAMVQHTVDTLADKPRTAEGVFSILTQIFKCALNHGLVRINPTAIICYKPHERTHGTALTKDEERQLLEAFDGTPYAIHFALMLYAGLRPGEIVTAQIGAAFITAKNSKRKGGKVEVKKIPRTPVFERYARNNAIVQRCSEKTLERHFKKVLPRHKLYDLRTTFQTRCTECGISDTVIGLFMGNSIGKLKETYTDLSDEFLISEGQKLDY